MIRYFFRGQKVSEAAKMLLGDRKDYAPEHYIHYEELEVVVQDDGRFSVWGNRGEDSDLLQDTRKDYEGLIDRVKDHADEFWEDSEEPEENSEEFDFL